MDPVHSRQRPLQRGFRTKILRFWSAAVRKLRSRPTLEGALFGGLIGFSALLLGFTTLIHADIFDDFLILPVLAGVVLAHTRVRSWLRFLAAFLMTAVLLVGYTPTINFLMPSLQRSDVLRPVPAIVVLSSYLYRDGTLNDAGQERVMQGYLLLRRGYSNRLVLTQAASEFGSQVPFVNRQMHDLGLDYTVEVTGLVHDTHDEALEVARLARRHGWSEVILVTHPWHMLRARSVFEKAGVHVLCSPCQEGNYDLHNLAAPVHRLQAFRDWLHEIIGYYTYKLRGWI